LVAGRTQGRRGNDQRLPHFHAEEVLTELNPVRWEEIHKLGEIRSANIHLLPLEQAEKQ
jgi:hypothetical protein